LHASVYHARGYVQDEDLVGKAKYIGHKEDPYQRHAQYFVVERELDGVRQVVATARLIYADPNKGYQSFQTIVHQPIYEKYSKMIHELDPDKYGEISALVKLPGEDTKVTIMLYREIWHYTLSHGYSKLLMSCDARLFQSLKILFGDSLVKIGDAKYFKGHNVVPAMLDITSSVDNLLKVSRYNPLKRHLQLKVVKFFLRGLPSEFLPRLRAVELQSQAIRQNSHE
jgi:hypothetical protein